MFKADYQQVTVDPEAPTYDKKLLETAAVRDQYLGLAMILLLGCSRFVDLMLGLKNN